MRHFLDPTAEPVLSPPVGKVLWEYWEPWLVLEIVPHADRSALVDALNQPSFADYRRSQCGAGNASPRPGARRGIYFHALGDVKATLAVLRAQIARLTDITEWEELT